MARRVRGAWFRPKLRTAGLPGSANGASSFHLRWLLPPGPALLEVSAVLEIQQPPAVDRLYFWALQASFTDDARHAHGGAHLGLQWNARHPKSCAANWGGYAGDGLLLEGSPSPLASAPQDPNTRDYPWHAERRYRLHIGPSVDRAGWWRGTITDLESGTASVVRDLHGDGGGNRLTGPVVWSEVFARCDDPSVRVRWSDMQALTVDGEVLRPRGVEVSYEPHAAGGCDNTDVVAGGHGLVQVTNTARITGHAAIVALPPC